jgi:putative transcriptional regulator
MGSKINNSYRSDVAGAVYEMMSDAHDAGVVSKATLKSFDSAYASVERRLARDVTDRS